MARHILKNSRYTFIANTDKARDEILGSMLFGMEEITNEQLNAKLSASDDEPLFTASSNFDALVWEH